MVRVPAAAAPFIACCIYLHAGLGQVPARTTDARAVSGAALCPVAVTARYVEICLGLWTSPSRRLRVARISVRRFRTRLAYSANTFATRQTRRFSCKPATALAGDIELNPGPDTGTAVAPPGALTAYHVNPRTGRGGANFALPSCFSEISKNLRLDSHELFST